MGKDSESPADGAESILPQLKEATKQIEAERFADFIPEKIISAFHGAFAARRKFNTATVHRKNLPQEPRSIKDLKNHPLWEQFREAQQVHLDLYHQMRSF
jgi:hypothetical protein